MEDISPRSYREGFKVMGFCPQFDALWPDMTGRLTLAAAFA